MAHITRYALTIIIFLYADCRYLLSIVYYLKTNLFAIACEKDGLFRERLFFCIFPFTQQILKAVLY